MNQRANLFRLPPQKRFCWFRNFYSWTRRRLLPACGWVSPGDCVWRVDLHQKIGTIADRNGGVAHQVVRDSPSSFALVHVCVRVRVRVCVCVRMCVGVLHTHTHTHIYIYIYICYLNVRSVSALIVPPEVLYARARTQTRTHTCTCRCRHRQVVKESGRTTPGWVRHPPCKGNPNVRHILEYSIPHF